MAEAYREIADADKVVAAIDRLTAAVDRLTLQMTVQAGRPAAAGTLRELEAERAKFRPVAPGAQE